MMTIVGKNVCEFRKKLNLSQLDLGKIIGLHQAALSRVENGQQHLTENQLFELGKVFKVQLEEFFKYVKICSCGECYTSIPTQAKYFDSGDDFEGWYWDCVCKSTLYVKGRKE